MREQGLVAIPELVDPVDEQLGQGREAISNLQGPCEGDTGLPSAGVTARVSP